MEKKTENLWSDIKKSKYILYSPVLVVAILLSIFADIYKFPPVFSYAALFTYFGLTFPYPKKDKKKSKK